MPQRVCGLSASVPNEKESSPGRTTVSSSRQVNTDPSFASKALKPIPLDETSANLLTTKGLHCYLTQNRRELRLKRDAAAGGRTRVKRLRALLFDSEHSGTPMRYHNLS